MHTYMECALGMQSHMTGDSRKQLQASGTEECDKSDTLI